MKANWTGREVLPTETGFFGTGKINYTCSRVKILYDLPQFASFFANETDMTPEELKELRDIVDNKIESEKTSPERVCAIILSPSRVVHSLSDSV